VSTPIPISRATTSTAALSGGNNRATALSLNVCPYRATSVLHRRPRGSGSMEATTILTWGVPVHLVNPTRQLQQVLEVKERAQVVLGNVQGEAEDVTPARITLELAHDRDAAVAIDQTGAVGVGLGWGQTGGLKLMLNASTHVIFLSSYAHQMMRACIMQ